MKQGACYGNENPDLWFPELGRGMTSPTRLEKVGRDINTAVAVCSTCPIKDDCLEYGMQPDNINYGIWGGLLAAERLFIAGEREGDHHRMTPQGDAINLYNKVRPYLGGGVLN